MHAGHLDVGGSLGAADAALVANIVIANFPIKVIDRVPLLSSRPGAPANLYLDFDGHFQDRFYGCDSTIIGDICGGGHDDITTQPFDRDGDPTTFSSAERDAIRQIWARVSEDYAPFNINVTTVDPGEFSNSSRNMRIAIGGQPFVDGSGVAYVNTFTNDGPNIAFSFGKRSDGTNYSIRKVGETVSHEAGHTFGLLHQSEYNSSGVKTAEYNDGDANRAPIMGDSDGATRGLWWRGPTNISSNTFLSASEGQYTIFQGVRYILGQDDLARLARSANGFGYRADDHYASYNLSTPLLIGTNMLTGAGVIERTTDKDMFRFETGGGWVSVFVNNARFESSVSGNMQLGNLDATVELRNSSGAVVASANPSNSLDAQITANLSAGTYYVTVGSAGNYGDIGKYTVNVTETKGPRVVEIQYGSLSDSLNGIWVTFNEPILHNSFTTADVIISAGLTRLTVNSVNHVIDGNDRTFLITHAKTNAAINVTIGPNITDFFNNPMNQDNDGFNGEAVQDAFTASTLPVITTSSFMADSEGPAGGLIRPNGGKKAARAMASLDRAAVDLLFGRR